MADTSADALNDWPTAQSLRGIAAPQALFTPDPTVGA